MVMNDKENRQRVRAENPRREGIGSFRTWHQQVTIGDEGSEQIVHLKGKTREEIDALKHAIEQAVLTHEVWKDLQDLFARHETANILRTQAQISNRRANTLLFEHGIRLKGFILPDPFIGHVK